MAIKFVDKESGDAGDKPKRAKTADAPLVGREPDAEALKESVELDLSHSKPAPRKRGQK